MPSHSPKKVRHRIEPLWDSRNDAVTAHVCLPDRADHHPAAELAGLAAAAARIAFFLAAGERFLLCLPVSLVTLASAPSRAAFLESCNAIPAAARPYLVFILGGIPADISRAGLAGAAMTLRPFGRSIAALSPECRDLAPYINHAINGLALDFAAGFDDDERTRMLISCAGEAAHDLRWGAMALGLDDPDLLAAVRAADFRFLHGPALAGTGCAFQPAHRAIGTNPDARVARI